MKTRTACFVKLMLVAVPAWSAWSACEDEADGGGATTPSDVVTAGDDGEATAADSAGEATAPNDTATTADSAPGQETMVAETVAETVVADAADTTVADTQETTDTTPEVEVRESTDAALLAGLKTRTIDGTDILADLYLPAGVGPFAAVVVIHGGGFVAGARDGKAETTWAEYLQANQFAAFSIDYRLGGDLTGPSWDAQLGDVKCAVMWLRQHAPEYRIDPDRLFVIGGSAGGWFSDMLAVTGDEAAYTPTCSETGSGVSNRVAGAIAYFGPSNLLTILGERLANDPTYDEAKSELNGLVGNRCKTDEERQGICTTASPALQVDADDAPVFLLHSDDDPVVPVQQSADMRAGLLAAGVAVEYREVTGLAHGWHAKFNDAQAIAARDAVLAWLKAHAGY